MKQVKILKGKDEFTLEGAVNAFIRDMSPKFQPVEFHYQANAWYIGVDSDSGYWYTCMVVFSPVQQVAVNPDNDNMR